MNLRLLILEVIGDLEPNAYGVTVRMELGKRGRKISYGRLYVNFDRLERDGLIISKHGDPTSERGNRPKRLVFLTNEGRRELKRRFDGGKVDLIAAYGF